MGDGGNQLGVYVKPKQLSQDCGQTKLTKMPDTAKDMFWWNSSTWYVETMGVTSTTAQPCGSSRSCLWQLCALQE